MAGLKLYYDLMSQPSRAVSIFLRYNNIPFEAKPVALRKGEHFTPEYTKINPFQKVPVLDDNDFIITESVAILKYLCTKYPDAVTPNWYPKDIQQRTRVDEYMAWQHTNIRFAGGMYFRYKVLEPFRLKEPVDTVELGKYEFLLEHTLDLMEKVVLSKGDYIVGNDMTLADLLAICEVIQPYSGGLEVTQGRPKLKAWMERVQARLQPYFEDAHKLSWKVRKQQLAKL